jgi:tRNA (guanine37-N1)-methyltransferase
MTVPDVLLSGDHGRIENWRRQQRLERTRSRRPDLLSNGNESDS